MSLWSWLVGDCCGVGGRLVWTASDLVLGVAVGAALLAWVLAALPGRGGASPLARVAELGCLAVALAVAAAAAGGPVWVQEGERKEEGRFVVLVDGSRSMGVLEADGAPRSADAAEILARLDDGAEVYTFGDQLRAGPPSTFDDGDSDLGGALTAIAQRHAGERLSGIAVITDGIDRGGLRRRVLDDPAASLPKLAGPLTLYQVGEARARTDLAVTDVRGGSFAFLRAPFEIVVDVKATGTARRSVPVALTRDGAPAGTAEARLDASGVGSARFTITPDTPGRYVYEATVPTLDGDAVPANNALTLGVRVVRDRLRVLQVCGSPSWDQKFLRLFLKEDPAVDLVSFFILRTPADMGAGWEGSELSLIQFPYERLFTSELHTFDLVILQNFDHAPYFARRSEALLQNLATYVREGGALAMVGGDRSFDLGQYAGTPIEDVLPVHLGVGADAIDPAGFAPTLTEAGAAHPITQLVSEPTENAAIWRRSSALDGLNLSLGARAGAAVLLAHPTRRAPNGAPLPVLAVSEVGKGRTLALMGDSSWRWSFGEAGAGQGNSAYLRFWKNAMRWMVGDPDDRPVVVEPARENWRLGETVRLSVRVRDASFQPVAGANAEVVVDGPGGRVVREASSDAEGVASVEVPADARGAHRVKATARRGQAVLGVATGVYAVTTRDPELDDVEPAEDFLAAFAARVDADWVKPDSWRAPRRDPSAGRIVSDRRETPIHAAPLVPLVVAVFASASWALRRRGGLR